MFLWRTEQYDSIQTALCNSKYSDGLFGPKHLAYCWQKNCYTINIVVFDGNLIN